MIGLHPLNLPNVSLKAVYILHIWIPLSVLLYIRQKWVDNVVNRVHLLITIRRASNTALTRRVAIKSVLMMIVSIWHVANTVTATFTTLTYADHI